MIGLIARLFAGLTGCDEGRDILPHQHGPAHRFNPSNAIAELDHADQLDALIGLVQDIRDYLMPTERNPE